MCHIDGIYVTIKKRHILTYLIVLGTIKFTFYVHTKGELVFGALLDFVGLKLMHFVLEVMVYWRFEIVDREFMMFGSFL